ncbi:MAG: hypothetical protein R3C53_00045 [Pirellulaceae bacterium]
MRITTISSSIASVVARVIAEVAGSAVRTFLHLTHMREHMLLDLGYWLEPCQPGFTCGNQQSFHSNPLPGKQPGLLRLLGISALAVCPAPYAAASAVRLATVRANDRFARSRG